MTSTRGWSRRLVPFSGGLLIGVSLFWVLPEMASFFHWINALAWVVGGACALWAVDRFIYPVCPACSGPHDHDHCASTLHGFAPPLILAAAIHSLLDGWSVASAGTGAAAGVSTLLANPLGMAVAIHKIPEGLALGVIMRAAVDSPRTALGWCVLAQAATVLGAASEMAVAPYLSAGVLHALLAVAGGTFLYLGGHAIHGEFQRRGLASAIYPALAGIASPSVFRLLGRG